MYNMDNPVLTRENWSYPINHVSHAGATVLHDGTTLLLCRVEGQRGESHFCAARSVNGMDDWCVDSGPTLVSEGANSSGRMRGIEVPRITYAPELDEYLIAYTVITHSGPAVALARTGDFKKFEQYGIVMPPADTDAAILPYKIGGYWVMLHRSVNMPSAHMWLSYSLDLKNWNKHVLIGGECNGNRWNANKINLLPPPIETSEGWLMIYHEALQKGSDLFHRIGLALFDKDNPEICIKRAGAWIPDVEETSASSIAKLSAALSCGHTIGTDGDAINLYYAGSDSSISVVTGSVSGLLSHLDQFSSQTKEIS